MAHRIIKTNRISKWEYLMPLMIILSLALSCFLVSQKKPFWNDELFSFYFLSDPSFKHMLQAFSDKLNNTPFVYFGIGWFWDKMFGSSELSLRLFSSLGMGIASFFVWVTLRHAYGFVASSVATTAAFCTSSMILNQNSEARMYGLYMALSAVVFYLYSRINHSRFFSNRLFYCNLIAHAALVNTHLHGLFYSAAVLTAFLIRDKLLGVLRGRVYLSIFLGWSTLIFYIPSFLVQADAGNPSSWLPAPSIRDLLDFLFLLNSDGVPMKSYVVLAVLFLGCWLSVIDKSVDESSPFTNKEDLPENMQSWSLLVFSFAFLVMPVVIFITSRAIKPIFYDRYMIPTVVGWAAFLAYVLSRLFNARELPLSLCSRTFSWGQIVRSVSISTLIALMLAQPIRLGMEASLETKNFDINYSTMGYLQLPIVVQVSGRFLRDNFYSSQPERYYYILDEAAAMDPASGQFGPQVYKHMEAWKRVYPRRFERQVLTSDAFLRKHDSFLVIDFANYNEKCPARAPRGLQDARQWTNLECPQWLEKRILANPQYRVKKLSSVGGGSWLLITKIS